MSLRLEASHVAEIESHLRRTYPEEGCGVLVGRDQGALRVVERVVPLANRRDGSRHDRFELAPEELLVAEREARDAGMDVVGFFHSHPDHPAVPSSFDLEHAWPYYTYLIVSVARGEAVETSAWRLAPDRTRFEPEPLVILPGVAPDGPAHPEDP